jgi:hypothetical protein
VNFLQFKVFFRDDLAKTKRRIFGKSNPQRIFWLLAIGLPYLGFKGVEEMTIEEKTEANRYAQIERERQAGFDGIEQSAKDLRRMGADETENYQDTLKFLIKEGATPSEMRLRLKQAGFSKINTNEPPYFTEFTNGVNP